MAKITSVQVVDNSAEVLEAMRSQVLKGLAAIGQEAEGFAKEQCPVDTGRLRNSITNEVDDGENAVYIGSNVEYAPYVEYGDKATHKTGGAHFLRDAVSSHTDLYKSIMESALES